MVIPLPLRSLYIILPTNNIINISMPIPPEDSCTEITFRQGGLIKGAGANIHTTSTSQYLWFQTQTLPYSCNQISLTGFQTLRLHTVGNIILCHR